MVDLLFSMADQLRFDAISAVNPLLHTPHLDRLAAEGVRFSKAYSSTPTCTPARAALLTGRSPWNHGMLGYGVIAVDYPFEFPRALSNGSGYETITIGKDHFGWNNNKSGHSGGTRFAHSYASWTVYDGLVSESDTYHEWFSSAPKRGANVSRPEDCWPTLDMNSWSGAPYACDEYLHPTAWTGRAAVTFLETRARAGRNRPPFLLKVSFHRPHSPYDPPNRLLNATAAADVPSPVRPATGWSRKYRDCGEKSSADTWCGEQSASAESLSRRAYHASVAFVDEQIGQIHQTLRRTGLLATTLWLFTSDHGDAQGDHWHWRKGYPYEFSSHVPMILRWPDRAWPIDVPRPNLRRGAVLPELIELRDVAPTLLHAPE